VLEAVFVLLELPSPSRRIFIGSHSLPPLWFAVSVLHLLKPENFYELVNKAISQEDAMKKAHRDKKRPSGFAPGSGTNKKFRFVKKNVPNPSQQSSTGRWTMKPSQGKPSGNFQFRNTQQQAPKPNAPPHNIGDRRCYNCGQPGHYINDCAKPKQIKPNPQNQVHGTSLPLRLRGLWCKSAKAS
jgi:hypothetical protein